MRSEGQDTNPDSKTIIGHRSAQHDVFTRIDTLEKLLIQLVQSWRIESRWSEPKGNDGQLWLGQDFNIRYGVQLSRCPTRESELFF